MNILKSINKILQIIIFSLIVSACCNLYTGNYARITRSDSNFDTIYIKEKCKYNFFIYEYEGQEYILVDTSFYPVKYY